MTFDKLVSILQEGHSGGDFRNKVEEILDNCNDVINNQYIVDDIAMKGRFRAGFHYVFYAEKSLANRINNDSSLPDKRKKYLVMRSVHAQDAHLAVKPLEQWRRALERQKEIYDAQDNKANEIVVWPSKKATHF